MSSTLGAAVGYVVFRVALRLPPLGRWADAATWPVATERRTDEHAAPGGRLS